jgi:transcriptional antiterminator RfaH
MKHWFVVQTHIRNEIKAGFHIRSKGFEVYIPQFLRMRRHARKQDWIKSPLFPSYLFVSFDIERDRWQPINSTIGVSQLICHGERPSKLPDGIISEIRDREDETGNININNLKTFAPGEVIQVVKGALADQLGVFECQSGKERVRVMLNLLGRPLNVELPLESISAAN